jgi:Flp pilus assembly protein TadG
MPDTRTLSQRTHQFWFRPGPTRFLSDTTGASAVEFAFVAPIAILILVGTIAYGLIFSTHLSLQHLIAETGRATIPGLAPSERRQLARQHFEAMLDTYPLLNRDFAELEVEADGAFTEVRIRYAVDTHAAYVFEGLLPLPDSPYTYRQVIRNGGG